MSAEIPWMSARDIADQVRRGELSATEVAEAMVRQVERVNPRVNAIIHWQPEQLMRAARALDEQQAKHGTVIGPLHGVPYTIKDLTAVAGIPLTLGVPAFRDQIPTHDAPIVQRMKGSGGLFLGKTNTPAFGYAGLGSNRLFGATRNPWNTALTSGGSSSGAGAAVASGLGPLAEGSDGGGSVRAPAAFNGIVGLKPSLGRIPQIGGERRFETNIFHGPMTRTVADAALMLDVTAGEYAGDPLSLPDPLTPYLNLLDRGIAGWRIAYSPDLGFGEVDPEIAAIVERAVLRLAEAGATVEFATPDWPHPDEAMWNGLWVPGLASLNRELDLNAMRGEIDDELIELVQEGERLSATSIAAAETTRGKIFDAYTVFTQTYRVLASPTTAVAAFPANRFNPEHLDGRPLRDRLLGWCLTHVYNMTTHPAISVPCGFTEDGCPVGMMLAGRLHADGDVLRAARAFEQIQPWAQFRPDAAGNA